MNTKIEGKLVKIMAKKPYEKDGVIKPTKIKSTLVFEYKSQSDGFERTEYLEINSLLPPEEFALGSFKAEIKISAWQSNLTFILIRVIK